MSDKVVWLHEKALSVEHAFLNQLNPETRLIHVWDDEYYQRRNYSLKRLVFIYETLCDLPVDIIAGNTVDVFKKLHPRQVLTPYTADSEVKHLMDKLSEAVPVKMIHDHEFVDIEKDLNLKRFFRFWNKAKQSALSIDGVPDAKRD